MSQSAPPGPGILLLQLGTPDAPTTPAVRRYLAQFLSDRRVIDLPRAKWLLVLHGIVLRTRPRRSAALYRRIWTEEGSPLAVISARQASGLAARLNARGDERSGTVRVAVAMRYGQPSIASAVRALEAAGVERILALPMYPQYASASTGSSLECLFGELATRRVVPSLRLVPPYPGDTGYINALAATARRSLEGVDVDHLVVSFHGMPERYVLDEPYADHCTLTARLLLRALEWPEDRATMTYQSRFGSEPWLQPYTDETLVSLARGGVRRVAAICPGFPADCLETLEEMAITNRELFLEAGGTGYHFIPGLNDSDEWLDALADMAARELQGWV